MNTQPSIVRLFQVQNGHQEDACKRQCSSHPKSQNPTTDGPRRLHVYNIIIYMYLQVQTYRVIPVQFRWDRVVRRRLERVAAFERGRSVNSTIDKHFHMLTANIARYQLSSTRWTRTANGSRGLGTHGHKQVATRRPEASNITYVHVPMRAHAKSHDTNHAHVLTIRSRAVLHVGTCFKNAVT